MKVMMRSGAPHDVCVIQEAWETLRTIEAIDERIRMLQVARKWLADAQKRVAEGEKK
jgi:hypothetical protein